MIPNCNHLLCRPWPSISAVLTSKPLMSKRSKFWLKPGCLVCPTHSNTCMCTAFLCRSYTFNAIQILNNDKPITMSTRCNACVQVSSIHLKLSVTKFWARWKIAENWLPLRQEMRRQTSKDLYLCITSILWELFTVLKHKP